MPPISPQSSLCRPACRAPFSVLGFTIVELLVVISIIATLVLISNGMLARSRVNARATLSINQLKTIGIALDQYRFDHQGNYPAINTTLTLPNGQTEVTAWTRDPLSPYLPLRPGRLANLVFVCPNARYEGFNDNTRLTRTFAAAASLIGLNAARTSTTDLYKPRHFFSIGEPGKTPIVFDAKQSGATAWCAASIYQSQMMQDMAAVHHSNTNHIDFRHNGVAHFLYADGHIEALTLGRAKEEFTPRMWMGIW